MTATETQTHTVTATANGAANGVNTPKEQHKTTGKFRYLKPDSYTGKPFAKIDGTEQSYKITQLEREVEDMRGRDDFDLNTSGFAVYREPSKFPTFTDDLDALQPYFRECEELLRRHVPGCKQICTFDHTIRRRADPEARQPVPQLHVDQTNVGAFWRVSNHMPAGEAEELAKGRFMVFNIWRPIKDAVVDFPLALIDWRTTKLEDFVDVDLMRRKHNDVNLTDEERRKELTDGAVWEGGYEKSHDTLMILPNDNHRFYYARNITPEEVIVFKNFDSHGEDQPNGIKGVPTRVAHSAFSDPDTPEDAPYRQSVEVRCLVFF